MDAHGTRKVRARNPTAYRARRRRSPMAKQPPAYLRVAAHLRDQIRTGRLTAGTALPTEAQLVAEYGVSITVVKGAIGALKWEGLVEGRRGSGVYVRSSHPLAQYTVDRRNVREGHPLPDVGGQWDVASQDAEAEAEIAGRLQIDLGSSVTCTTYRLSEEGRTVRLVKSWEPMRLADGTLIEWPGRGPRPDIIGRLDTIGLAVATIEERVTTRAARPDELTALNLSGHRHYVLAVARTHFLDSGRPIETADVVLPGELCEIVNTFNVG
ncbi:GntR family transcriptional regulator [Catellatospora sp. NPDC049133]|uniref:GntR family transcriptional regulator n=1 Tax=Catellatospora sp. NPDC049133 TaxID=3155499 RepID=UPI0034050C74